MNLYLEFDRIVVAFEVAGIRYALVGGLAVGMHGYLRTTKDMDFLLHPDDIETAAGALKRLGYLVPREPWTFRHTQLSVWRFVKPVRGQDEVYLVDVLTGKGVAYRNMLKRAERHPLGEKSVAVVSRRDLVRMKRSRSSAQDLADIERLRSGHNGIPEDK